MDKTEKILMSLLILSLIPPFAFPEVKVYHYSFGDHTSILPDLAKLGYTGLILIIFALYEIWKPKRRREG